MNRQELEEAIREAGNKFDGHVTNGSHAEIMKVVDEILNQVFATSAPMEPRRQCWYGNNTTCPYGPKP